ncbi:MAG: DUF6320 domain-containing protein [Marinilabiliaceae bacterium]
MVHCPYCGVELEENANFCSLCGAPLPEKNKDNLAFIKSAKEQQEEKLLTDFRKLTTPQKRRLLWKISGMVLISIIVVTLVIDLVSNQKISWSKFPATISLVAFINTTLAVFWHKKTLLWFSLSFLSTSALLVLLDIYTQGTGWGMKLGIPLLLAAYITIFVFFKLIRNTHQKGMNIIAYSLIAAGILSLCIDGIISLYASETMAFDWSLIVMASACIIAALLLYVHFRLKKATDLRRFFHI